MTQLRATAARLALGSRGRTEADIQSDVRQFLLEAPLELAGDDVIEVALEAQAGDGRRIDVEAGCVAIEVKKSLASATVFDAAVRQLTRYVRQRTEEGRQRYVGVLTDGRLWVLFHLEPGGTLAPVSQMVLTDGGDALRLSSWLEPVLATADRVQPTPEEIVRRLGCDSPAAQLDLADLHALYEACRTNNEVQLKRELWARLLLCALGTNFEDSDELFVMHTYLVLTAELIAHEVMGIPIDAPNSDVRALLEGQQFAIAGLHGVVEADFFDWPAAVAQGKPIIAGIARRLSRFDWSSVNHDVLKALYESVIDTETRHKLGEYYTPDWLAQKMVEETFDDPLHQRLLDPACGSGTFLFWAVRRVLAACDDAGIPNREALDRVVRQVQGMDLHPVAVTLARVTYLLALTPERLGDRSALTIPVFLGDSVRWEQDDTLLSQGGITVHTSDGLELIQQELHFPEGVVDDPDAFDRLVSDLATRASKRKPGSAPPSIAGLLNRHKINGASDREAVDLAFRKLCRLHDAGRDHVWAYYIRNLSRPLSFIRPDRQADVLVGNPPWLAYRSMPIRLQQTYRLLAEQLGLWAGGKVATHQDLSDLFVVRSIEQYLRPGGRFAFVMPFGVLSRRQFAGFRTARWTGVGSTTSVRFNRPDDLARVKPPLFPMPSCVISGSKKAPPIRLPASATVWTGRITGAHMDWPAARLTLARADADVETAVDSAQSPYRSRFRQGATLVPRMLITVERAPGPGRLGVTAGQIAVRSARSANEKSPWKNLGPLEKLVEDQFVRAMHLGSTIVAYRARTPGLAVIPFASGVLLDGANDRLDEFPGLAAWWRDAEEIWNANRTAASRLTLLDRINFQKELSKQFPLAEHRVVYTKSGQHIAACRIEDASAVIDHKLYWAPVDSIAEGHYLCAVLNSRALSEAVLLLQARGQHNPRDFDKHVFSLPFPAFDATNVLHTQIAALAARAELVAAQVELSDNWQFQKARRIIREALREDGVAAQVDRAVVDLIATAIGGRTVEAETAEAASSTPDLMGALAKAISNLPSGFGPAPRARRKKPETKISNRVPK